MSGSGEVRWGWLAMFAALALAVVVGLGRRGIAPAHDNVAATAKVEIAGETLKLRPGYLRPAPDLDSVEFAAFYPGFLPAGAADDVDARTDLDERLQRIVFMTLRPADPKLAPADRTARLYMRFLDSNGWSHPGGLISRPFAEGSPFEGDELFFVAPEGRAFAARCPKADSRRKGPDTCVAALRSGDIDVELRFARPLLAEWQAVTAGALGLIEAARR